MTRPDRRNVQHLTDSPADSAAADPSDHHITVHLDRVLADRGMTLTELSERVGLTLANLSVLKTGRARAVRFTTLSAICAVLECQPGDLLAHEPGAA